MVIGLKFAGTANHTAFETLVCIHLRYCVLLGAIISVLGGYSLHLMAYDLFKF